MSSERQQGQLRVMYTRCIARASRQGFMPMGEGAPQLSVFHPQEFKNPGRSPINRRPCSPSDIVSSPIGDKV